MEDRCAGSSDIHTEHFATHDTLQQMMNLTNMLTFSKEYEQAEQLLHLYDNIVLEVEGLDSFDYAICQLGKGLLAFFQNEPVHAEIYLLDAERRLAGNMGENSAYVKTAYLYLHYLYSRWNKKEKALGYQEKLFSVINKPIGN